MTPIEQIIYFSLIGVFATLLLTLLILLILNLYIKKFVNFLESKQTSITRDQSDFINSLKRFKALKEQNSNYVNTYKSLLSLENIISNQKEKLDKTSQELYSFLKKKKILAARKTLKIFTQKYENFKKSIHQYQSIIGQISANWNNYEGDITDILNKLSLAREYLNKNQKVLHNLYGDLKSKIDRYSERISFIDDQWNNQAKFENVSTSISNLIVDLEYLFDMLDHAKVIEFCLYGNLPKAFEIRATQIHDLEKQDLFFIKNKFYKLQQKALSYQVDAIKDKIIDFYLFFHKNELEEFKNKALHYMHTNLTKIIKNLCVNLQKQLNYYDFIDIKTSEKWAKVIKLYEKLSDSNFEEYIKNINKIIHLLEEINYFIIEHVFENKRQQTIDLAFQEELSQSVHLYFEIMQNEMLISAKYHSNLEQLKNMYQQFFTKKPNFVDVEKIWNRWVESLSVLIEEIALNEHYKSLYLSVYTSLMQSERNILQTNAELAIKLKKLTAVNDYQEAFRLLKRAYK